MAGISKMGGVEGGEGDCFFKRAAIIENSIETIQPSASITQCVLITTHSVSIS